MYMCANVDSRNIIIKALKESALSPRTQRILEGNVRITSWNVHFKAILNDRKCEPLFWYQQLKWIFGGGGPGGGDLAWNPSTSEWTEWN
jgi:hypothetical protein